MQGVLSSNEAEVHAALIPAAATASYSLKPKLQKQ